MLVEGWPCATKCGEKDGTKCCVERVYEEVSRILNTLLNMRIFGMVVSQDSHVLFFCCFTSCCCAC